MHIITRVACLSMRVWCTSIMHQRSWINERSRFQFTAEKKIIENGREILYDTQQYAYLCWRNSTPLCHFTDFFLQKKKFISLTLLFIFTKSNSVLASYSRLSMYNFCLYSVLDALYRKLSVSKTAHWHQQWVLV